MSILDPAIHTPERTFGRCPFLFTVGAYQRTTFLSDYAILISVPKVCAIASRYYAPKASIYKYAMHFAKTAAASSLIDGWKSVELCQAYLLLSVYSVPARRWEDDRSWLYLGLAIRWGPENLPFFRQKTDRRSLGLQPISISTSRAPPSPPRQKSKNANSSTAHGHG
jgi:hypothetical protein